MPYYDDNPSWDLEGLVELYPEYEAELLRLNAKQGKWLEDRFIRRRRKELHPFPDALASLLAFTKQSASLQQKYSTNAAYLKHVQERLPHLKSLDITHLSSDDMETLMLLAQRKKQRFAVAGTENVERDFVAKVGEWNIWMPTTRENSVVIAGYDPDTFEPCTTWCTARTAGSNMFYNYAGHGIILFYLIHERPSKATDWLSVGWVDGQPVLEGDDGGVSVDSKNRGLTENDLKRHLGRNLVSNLQDGLRTYDAAMEVMAEYVEELGGVHPARAKIEQARHSIEAFDDLLVGLGKEEKDDLVKMVLEEGVTDSQVLTRLADDSNEYVRIAVAGNINTPAQVLTHLADDSDLHVRIAVAGNINTPAQVLTHLADDSDLYVRQSAARNTSTPAKLLTRLADDEYLDVRRAVAGNTSTPTKLLTRLADDEDLDVRRAVARNTSTPTKLLTRLADDSSEYVREGVAGNTSTPAKLLTRLADDSSEYVRRAVAGNTNTPAKVLIDLAMSTFGGRDVSILKSIAENTAAHADVLMFLVVQGGPEVREAIARNVHAPVEVLEHLTDDTDYYVRNAAAEQLAARSRANPRLRRLMNPRNY